MNARHVITLFLWMLVCLAGISRGDEISGHKLRIMQFNIWQEGTSVKDGFDKMLDVILASEADLIALSEVRNYKGKDLHKRILAALEAKAPDQTFYAEYAGGDVGLISRFPIDSKTVIYNSGPADSGSIAAWRITLPGGLKATICSAHLDFKGYGLNLIRGYQGGYPNFNMLDENKDGEPDRVSDVDRILEYNRRSQKDEAIKKFLDFAQEEEANGYQVILAGDFNDGSHLDWTERARDHFGHYGVAVPWDNSIALAEKGFMDAYRVAYPDEIHFPGFTWPAIADGKGSTSWAPKSDERDRIDFIYYGTKSNLGLKVLKAWLIGPKAFYIGNKITPNPGRDTFLCNTLPWPSDHVGVMVEFTW